jgi:hypothetical protein
MHPKDHDACWYYNSVSGYSCPTSNTSKEDLGQSKQPDVQGVTIQETLGVR